MCSFCSFFQVTVFQVVKNPGRPDNFTFAVDGSFRNMTAYITGASTLTFSLTSSTGVATAFVSEVKINIYILNDQNVTFPLQTSLELFVLVDNSVVSQCFFLFQVYLRVPVSQVVLWDPSPQQETYVV